jgi:hypothetical protein
MQRKHEKHECYDEPLAHQVVERIPERDISKLLGSLGKGWVIMCKGVKLFLIILAVGLSVYLGYLTYKLTKNDLSSNSQEVSGDN